MKIKYFLFVLTALISSCSKDDGDQMPNIKPSSEGVYDAPDGTKYEWVQIGGLQWMVKNMAVEPSEGDYSIYFEKGQTDVLTEREKAYNLKEYGYLYSYETAKTIVPEGWRIATDDDWKQLEKELGMNAGELNNIGWRGTNEGLFLQQPKDGCKLALKLGGMMNLFGNKFDVAPCLVGISGMYWTSTLDENDNTKAYCRQVRYKTTQLYRNSTLLGNYLSVRCVRDVK